MADSTRQWQTTIWIGDKDAESKTLYGDTFRGLRQAVRDWLTQNKPTFFYSTAIECLYSDGTVPSRETISGKLDEGWYLRTTQRYRVFAPPARSFEDVLKEFIAEGILPAKGPDYQDRSPVGEGKLQLHDIKTVTRERDIATINSLLKRGWYIIAIDQHAEPDQRSTYTTILLGHPEEDAM